MKLYRIVVPVHGIDRAAAVYSQLLQAPGERVSPGRHYFDCGGTILTLYDPEADGDGEQGGWRHHPNQYIYFAASHLEGALERARGVGCTFCLLLSCFSPTWRWLPPPRRIRTPVPSTND